MTTPRIFRIGGAITLTLCFLHAAVSIADAQTTSPTAKAKAKPKAKVKVEQKASDATPLDLNVATAEEMQEKLPGIGAVYAKKIVDGRPYKSFAGLSKLGIPERTLAEIKPLVTVKVHEVEKKTAATTKATSKTAAQAKGAAKSKRAATTLKPGQKVNVNTASLEDLDGLFGIGPAKARAIMNARPFKTIEDLKKVRGIGEATFEELKDHVTVK